MKQKILHELENHMPFTAIATLMAVVLTSLFLLLIKNPVKIITSLFYIIHPAHILFSSIVTAGLFYKYKKNFLYALLIGLTGSIIIGSLSDIFLPYLGGMLFQLNTEFHFTLIEKPMLIISVAVIGSFLGIITRVTKMPHFIHVFLSVFGSLFYLVAFSREINIFLLIIMFLIVFFAVLIPCCISDIIYPLVFVRRRLKGK